MFKSFLLVLVTGLAIFWHTSSLYAGDGIPDNCEYTTAVYHRPNIFPRYEPQNRRLLLVDWTTGTEVQTIATDLADTRILGWSADCRYLAVAVGGVESMDTVVFDTTTNIRVGSVADAHLAPHSITWGPGNFLVVETRKGAILWNVPANTQVTLTTSFDAFTGRNFSRLRWDATNMQLIANLAVGGREVYDLNTGQKIELAADVFTTEQRGTVSNTIVLGGKEYPCQPGNGWWWRNADRRNTGNITGVHPKFDSTSRVLALVVYTHQTYANYESVLIINDIFDNVPSIQFRGMSNNCRYLVASIGIPEKDASNTVVWDIIENRRVGSFENAHYIVHPLHFSSTGDALIVETREGGFLWYLPTNTRTLISDEVETALAGSSGIRTFSQLWWDEDEVFVVKISDPTFSESYNIRTGEFTGTHSPQPPQNPRQSSTTSVYIPPSPGTFVDDETGFGRQAYWWSSSDETCTYRARYNADLRQIELYNRQTNDFVSVLQAEVNQPDRFIWSPDCRYVYTDVSVRDNQNLPYDPTPLDDDLAYRRSERFIIWDVESGEQVANLNHFFRSRTNSTVWWSPTSHWALVRVTSGYYVLSLATQQSTLLTFSSTEGHSGIHTYATPYWDFQRGRVIVKGWSYIFAFDLFSGEERMRINARTSSSYYDYCEWFAGCSFWVRDPHIFVASRQGLTIQNLDTFESLQIDVDPEGTSGIGVGALSPDGRYYVNARSVLRVWDLSNLPEDFSERDPIGQYPAYGRVRRLQFIDNITIEYTTRGGETFHMNVETGERTPID